MGIIEVDIQTLKVRNVYTITRDDLKEKLGITEEIYNIAFSGDNIEVTTVWKKMKK